MNIHYALTRDANDNVVDPQFQFESSWDSFVSMIHEAPSVIEDKKENLLLIPARFKSYDDGDYACAFLDSEQTKVRRLDDGRPAMRRCSENMISQSVLPLDFDGAFSIDAAVKMFSDFEYVAHTSYSHRTERKGFRDCFRMYLLFDSPCPVDEYRGRKDAFIAWVGKENVDDPSSLYATHGFYIPAVHPDRVSDYRLWHNAGRRLDWRMFEHSRVNLSVVSPTRFKDDKTKQLVLDRLRAIYLGNYNEWLKVASALKDGGYDLHDFIQVTVGGLMQQKTAADCERLWSSCKPIPFAYILKLLKGYTGRRNINPILG